MIKKCKTCGAEFEARGKIRIATAKFCSRECYRKSGMRGERKPELRRNCIVCGKRFLPFYNQRKNKDWGNYCSMDCYTRARGSDTKYKCDYCGKEFTRKKHSFRKGNKRFYCSINCRNKSNRGENYNPDRIDYRDGQYKRLSKKLRENAKCCNDCGEEFEEYQVHHIIPPWLFDNRKEANDKKNLVVLCKKCHKKRHSKTIKFLFQKFREVCRRDRKIRDEIIKHWNN